MSDSDDKTGGVTRVLVKLGLMNVQGQTETSDPGPDARPSMTPESGRPGNATPESLQKLRADVGLDDDSSAYRRFMVILRTLEKTVDDATKRYRAAMDVAETQGVTAEAITGEFTALREKLELEGRKRMAALDTVIDGKVGPKKATLADLHGSIDAKRRELESLETQAAELERQLKADEEAFSGIAADMGATLDVVATELKAAEAQFRAGLNIKD